jgi:hypothetical protein
MTDGHTDEIKKDFYLITWKEFKNRKAFDKIEVVKVENPEDGINKLRQINAEKRVTTTDYRHYNLSELCEKNKLTLSD